MLKLPAYSREEVQITADSLNFSSVPLLRRRLIVSGILNEYSGRAAEVRALVSMNAHLRCN